MVPGAVGSAESDAASESGSGIGARASSGAGGAAACGTSAATVCTWLVARDTEALWDATASPGTPACIRPTRCREPGAGVAPAEASEAGAAAAAGVAADLGGSSRRCNLGVARGVVPGAVLGVEAGGVAGAVTGGVPGVERAVGVSSTGPGRLAGHARRTSVAVLFTGSAGGASTFAGSTPPRPAAGCCVFPPVASGLIEVRRLVPERRLCEFTPGMGGGAGSWEGDDDSSVGCSPARSEGARSDGAGGRGFPLASVEPTAEDGWSSPA